MPDLQWDVRADLPSGTAFRTTDSSDSLAALHLLRSHREMVGGVLEIALAAQRAQEIRAAVGITQDVNKWPAPSNGLHDGRKPQAAGGDAFNLHRFVTAQAGRYDDVLEEIGRGRKIGHWMWFVFPQIAGLGRSEMARHYALGSIAEARAYLAHPLLGPRLIAATEAIIAHAGRTPEAMLGATDAIKLQSSLTLFACAADDPTPFTAALATLYGGAADAETLRRLNA